MQRRIITGSAILASILLLTAVGTGQEPTLVIRNGTILTAASPPLIERGSILVRGGKIAAIGTNVPVPAGAEVIDATGMFVTPGIVDPHSHLGVNPWPSEHGNDSDELTDPISAQVRAVDSFNFEDPGLRRALAGGVTTIEVFPGAYNVVAGQSVVLKLRPDRGRLATVYAQAPPGMKMGLGENPTRTYGARNQMPATRMGQFAVLRQAFQRAKEYQERVRKADSGNPPARDLKLEALVEILEGRRNVHVHAYRQDEMLTMMAIAKEFGFRVRAFHHGIEAYKVADDLAANGIAVATWPDTYGGKIEMADGIPYNTAILSAHGVRHALKSDSPNTIQRMWHEAARTVRYGVAEETALKSITINGAWIAGVDKWTGSLEVGKDADVAIFNGHPFDIFTLVQKTIIDGDVIFDRARDWAKLNGLKGES